MLIEVDCWIWTCHVLLKEKIDIEHYFRATEFTLGELTQAGITYHNLDGLILTDHRKHTLFHCSSTGFGSAEMHDLKPDG